jgi:hypothetical protein
MEIEDTFMLNEKTSGSIAQGYATLYGLYAAQPAMTQHFLDQQASAIVSALRRDNGRIRYQLPDRIILEGGEILDLPFAVRPRAVGGLLAGGTRLERRTEFIRHLNGIEHGINPALAICGRLIRFSVAHMIVHHLVPDGRSVQYRCLLGDEIPSIPVGESQPSALLAATDAVTEAEKANSDGERLQVPYVAEARRFYLPQWVAFGEADSLLADSIAEAEACVASLENAVRLLEDASAICPGIVADETYQRKRAGLLGQLVNQGRAMARYETHGLVKGIQRRVQANSLNRGLSLDLTYFDDQALAVKNFWLEVIPAGRIMFVPAFVILAVRKEYDRITRDTRFNSSTRKHLLSLLAILEKAFLKKESGTL